MAWYVAFEVYLLLGGEQAIGGIFCLRFWLLYQKDEFKPMSR